MSSPKAHTAATNRQRTCIACGAQGHKGGLLRIVRSPEGEVCFDETGRMPGRGAYVCGPACFEKARSGRLQRALKTEVDKEACERLAVQLGSAQALKE